MGDKVGEAVGVVRFVRALSEEEEDEEDDDDDDDGVAAVVAPGCGRSPCAAVLD